MKINLPVDTTSNLYKHIIIIVRKAKMRGDERAARLEHKGKWWFIRDAHQTGRREVTLTLESVL